MELSNDLISQFVKVTKDEVEEKQETTVYGTIVIDDDEDTYVQLDGSDLLTPIASTVSTNDGDRVTVMIKDHLATVTGNLSDNAANGTDLETKVDSDSIIATINTSGETATISGSKVDITGKVTFNSFASSLQTEYNSIKSKANSALTSSDASEFLTSSDVEDFLTSYDVGTNGTTTIDGARITTGTIAAARIAVADLLAQNVTATGKIDFSNGDYSIGLFGPTVQVTGFNFSTYFDLDYGGYYFSETEYGLGEWKTTNAGVANSRAETSFIANTNLSMRFHYEYSTEANYDHFYIYIYNVNNELKETVIDGVSGVGSGTCTRTLLNGERITFVYTKNGSMNGNSDCCIISMVQVKTIGSGNNVLIESLQGDINVAALNNLYLRGGDDVTIMSDTDDIILDASNVIYMGSNQGVYVKTPSNPSNSITLSSGVTYNRVLTTADLSSSSSSSNADDYVVAEGTTTDTYGRTVWRYRKWNSGKAECWRLYSPYNGAGASVSSWAGSSWYATSEFSAGYFPFEFYSTPAVFYSFVSDTASGGGLVWVAQPATYEYSGAVRFIRPNSSTQYGDLAVYAFGTY